MSKENKVDNKVPRAPKNPQLGKVQGEQLKSCHQVSCLHHKHVSILISSILTAPGHLWTWSAFLAERMTVLPQILSVALAWHRI